MWDLLTKNFPSPLPNDYPVKLEWGRAAAREGVNLQVFEVAVARIFAELRPDFEWKVSPNRADDGVDFVGRQRFLKVDYLTIDAAVIVGGQCKKRTRVGKVVDEISGSLISMAGAINPTFFVVAFSARVDPRRVRAGRRELERELRRHCHILDRRQLEGLIHHHLPVVEEILRWALPEQADGLVAYFKGAIHRSPAPVINVVTPLRIRAGEPFSVAVEVVSPVVSASAGRIWWVPSVTGGRSEAVRLIGPVGCDSPAGTSLGAGSSGDDALRTVHLLEFDSYKVGDVELGEVLVGLEGAGRETPLTRRPLGRVQVVENLRPRFFAPPFRGILRTLGDEYERCRAGAVVSFGVVGPGGSGKTRVCETFSLERRRRGAEVISAKQAKTLNDPHRLVRDLLVALAPGEVSRVEPARDVLMAMSSYDAALADRAAPSISAVFTGGSKDTHDQTAQMLVSALVLLATARRRHSPLVIHLQDLHWASNDVLVLLDRLVSQLGLPDTSATVNGVFFLFEGRVNETYQQGDDVWTSAHFETFLDTLGCPIATCSAFSSDEALEFIRRLFEDEQQPDRLVEDDLLELQRDLVGLINRRAGGNPFHSLQLVRLLKAQGIVGLNPETGLLFMMQPLPPRTELPGSVYESIRARWEYLKHKKRDLALLIWAAALLEDRIAMPLFLSLRACLASHVSPRDVDATDILWTDEGAATHAAFRHELYFETLRQFDVTPSDRQRVVDAYAGWFGSLPDPGPLDLFRWARVMLEQPNRDVERAAALFDAAAERADRGGDDPLQRRIAAARLDLAWSVEDDAHSPTDTFLRFCDEELRLTRRLLGTDRREAARRLDALRERIGNRLRGAPIMPTAALTEVRKRGLTAEVRRSQVLFNDRAPDEAAEVAAAVVRDIGSIRRGEPAADDREGWVSLEVEALHSQAVSLALSADYDHALDLFERALDLARASASPLLLRVTSTYGNVLLARDPERAEEVLRPCTEEVLASPEHADLWSDVQLNRSLALIVLAYRSSPEDADRARSLLDEADRMMTGVFAESSRVGNNPDAGAAAVVLGILAALRGDESAASWFAQGVAAAARGRQMETLWRAHVNLASAHFQRRGTITPKVVNHAVGALEIMEDTLSRYPDPGSSSRFRLLRIGLAHIVRFLILAGDDRGIALLERYPELRRSFDDPERGTLRDDRGVDPPHHKWLRIGEADYVLY